MGAVFFLFFSFIVVTKSTVDDVLFGSLPIQDTTYMVDFRGTACNPSALSCRIISDMRRIVSLRQRTVPTFGLRSLSELPLSWAVVM